MAQLYFICLCVLPVALVAMILVSDHQVKYTIGNCIIPISWFILTIKYHWFKSWLSARKHGIKVSWLSALGPTLLNGLYTLLATGSFLGVWIWNVVTSIGMFNVVFNLLAPLILIPLTWYVYKDYKK